MADHRDTALLALPDECGRTLVLNAAVLPGGALRKDAVCEQGFRPSYFALERAGYSVTPQVDESGFDTALVLIHRSAALNAIHIARAWNAVSTGGRIVMSGDNKSAIKSLRKRLGEHVTGSVSKHHAVAFTMVRDGSDWPVPDSTMEADGYTTQAGTFSADRIDTGSKLLVRHFDASIRGCVADFGAGWGYLSAEFLKRAPDVGSIALYEANFSALEAARRNLSPWPEIADFKWMDVPSEFGSERFNHIIMNPPFHTDRAADPALGQAFIKASAHALMPGGSLLMVANRNLPYEATLADSFKLVEALADERGFKVMRAYT